MKINNENENYTLHFIFHTNILHIKFSWIHVMKKYQNNISPCEETRNIIHHYSSRTIYLSIDKYKYIFDYLIE